MKITIIHDTDSFFAGDNTEGCNVSASIDCFCRLQAEALKAIYPNAEIEVTTENRMGTKVYADNATYEQEEEFHYAVTSIGEEIFNSQAWYVAA